MPTKEEVEGKLEELRNKHEKLKMRYKEVSTKLELAKELLNRTVAHLTEIPPIEYRKTRGWDTPDEALKHEEDN